MTYQTPRLELLGSASGLVLGAHFVKAHFRDSMLVTPPRTEGWSRNTILQ